MTWQERTWRGGGCLRPGCDQLLPVLAPPLKGKVPDRAKEALTVAPALDSLPAGSTDGPGAQEEPVLAKLGTQGQGEQHPACWHGPGCRHLLAPSLPGHGEGGGLDKVGGGPGCRELATRGPSGLIQAGAGLSLEGDPALLGDNLTASTPPPSQLLGSRPARPMLPAHPHIPPDLSAPYAHGGFCE